MRPPGRYENTPENTQDDEESFSFFDMHHGARLPQDEIRVSYAKLRRLASDMDNLVFRAQYYEEKIELSWLRTFSEDLSRLLRGNRE